MTSATSRWLGMACFLCPENCTSPPFLHTIAYILTLRFVCDSLINLIFSSCYYRASHCNSGFQKHNSPVVIGSCLTWQYCWGRHPMPHCEGSHVALDIIAISAQHEQCSLFVLLLSHSVSTCCKQVIVRFALHGAQYTFVPPSSFLQWVQYVTIQLYNPCVLNCDLNPGGAGVHTHWCILCSWHPTMVPVDSQLAAGAG